MRPTVSRFRSRPNLFIRHWWARILYCFFWCCSYDNSKSHQTTKYVDGVFEKLPILGFIYIFVLGESILFLIS